MTLPTKVDRLAPCLLVAAAIAVSMWSTVFAAYDTDGLVGYWKFDETSGTTVSDVSGHNQTGTATGTPTISSDVPSTNFANARSLSFDGSSDYVDMGDVTNLEVEGGSFTISLWFNPTASPADGSTYALVTKGTPSVAGYSFQYEQVSGDFVMNISKYGVQDQRVTITELSTGTWYHWAGVQRSGEVEYFLNGVSQGTYTDGSSYNASGTNEFRIGNASNDSLYTNGLIDDVRVYSRELSASEITQLSAGNHTRATWDGSTDTDFETAANWDINAIPDPFTHLIVPDSIGGVVLSKPASGASLTLEHSGFTGAFLDLHGFDFEFVDGGELKGGGTLHLLGSESTSVVNHGTASTGTILYYGTGSYTGLATGDSYYNLTLNDGLIGYWNFDVQEGGLTPDVSGFDHDGARGTSPATPTFSSTYAPTVFSNTYAMSFDGSDDIVTVHSNDKISNVFKAGGTITAWINMSDWGEGDLGRIIDKSDSTNSGNGFSLLVSDSGDELRFSRGFSTNRGRWDTPDNSLSLNTWHHVAVTYNEDSSANDPRLFIDGISQTLSEGQTPAGTADTDTTIDLNIGNYQDGSRTFDGLIDDVRMYDRILEDHEISALAAGHMPATASGVYTLVANLFAKNDLTIAAGDLDASSSDYTVTLSGSWLNYGGQFSPQEGRVTFESASGTEGILTAGQAFYNFRIQSHATWELKDLLDVDGTLDKQTGTFDVTTSNYTIQAGNITNSGTFTARSGIVVLNGTANNTFTLIAALNELQIEDPTESGLVGYWKFDECQGDTTVDSSGTGNDGTLEGPPLWTGSSLADAIKFTNTCALEFDGTGRYVEVPDDDTLDLSSEFTLAGWVNVDNFDEVYSFIIAKDGAVDQSYDLGFKNSKPYVAINDGSWAEYVTDDNLSTGVWHHIAGVRYSDDSLVIYVDGVAKKTFTSVKTPRNATTNVTLGRRTSTGYEFDGTLDDVRIYNRSLSPIEVRRLAQGRYAEGAQDTATLTTSGGINAETLTIFSGKLGGSNKDIDISGDWNNYVGSGGFIKGTSSVDFDGSSTQNIRGSTEFYDLEITTSSAQTVNFGSGTTQYITNSVTFTGADSELLTLGPLTAGIDWLVDLSSGASQDIEYVSVSYSDASPGEQLEACTTNTDGGNNTNWDFSCVGVDASSDSTGNGGWRSNKQAISKAQGGSGDGDQVAQTDTESPTLADVGIATVEVVKKAVGGILDPSMREVYTPEEISRRAQEVINALSKRFEDGIHSFRTAQKENAEALKASALEDEERAMMLAERKIRDQKIFQLTASAIGEKRGLLVAEVASEEVVYADVPVDEWFAPYVSTLIDEEIAQGYTDEDGKPTGEFGVANPVTHAEILKMALQTTSVELVSGTPRNTSAQGTWASAYVKTAEHMRISIFTPDRNVHEAATRGEVIHTILKVIGLPVAPNAPITFSDLDSSHPYAQSIATAAIYGIVQGDQGSDGNPTGTVRPDAQINRAEVAKMIALLTKLLEN